MTSHSGVSPIGRRDTTLKTTLLEVVSCHEVDRRPTHCRITDP
jgi:hypothetical protein